MSIWRVVTLLLVSIVSEGMVQHIVLPFVDDSACYELAKVGEVRLVEHVHVCDASEIEYAPLPASQPLLVNFGQPRLPIFELDFGARSNCPNGNWIAKGAHIWGGDERKPKGFAVANGSDAMGRRLSVVLEGGSEHELTVGDGEGCRVQIYVGAQLASKFRAWSLRCRKPPTLRLRPPPRQGSLRQLPSGQCRPGVR